MFRKWCFAFVWEGGGSQDTGWCMSSYMIYFHTPISNFEREQYSPNEVKRALTGSHFHIKAMMISMVSKWHQIWSRSGGFIGREFSSLHSGREHCCSQSLWRFETFLPMKPPDDTGIPVLQISIAWLLDDCIAWQLADWFLQQPLKASDAGQLSLCDDFMAGLHRLQGTSSFMQLNWHHGNICGQRTEPAVWKHLERRLTCAACW